MMTENRKAGRPGKLTRELQDKLCASIADGLAYKDAAAIAGITFTTFARWNASGEKARGGKYRDFFVAVSAAKAEAKELLVKIVMDAIVKGHEEIEVRDTFDAKGKKVGSVETRRRIPRNPKLALQLLERRDPENYGVRVQHDGMPVGGGGGTINLQLVFDNGEGVPVGKVIEGERRRIKK